MSKPVKPRRKPQAAAAYFSLIGISHNLRHGEIIYCVDQGSTGGDGAVYVYSGTLVAVEIIFRKKYTREFAPQAILQELSRETNTTPSRIAYGVAAPVNNNACAAGVNMPFPVDGNTLGEITFPGSDVIVLVGNDFKLLLYRLCVAVTSENRVTLQTGKPSGKPSTITVAGAGGGLGVGLLLPIPGGGGGYLLQSLEGSHSRVATRYATRAPKSSKSKTGTQPTKGPWSSILEGVVPWWVDKYGSPPLWDHLISSGGLSDLVRYLVEIYGYTLPSDRRYILDPRRRIDPAARDDDAKTVGEGALVGSIDAYVDALRIWMDYFGSFLQATALLHADRAVGYEIYLAGGVLAGLLKDPSFILKFGPFLLEAFHDTPVTVDKLWFKGVPIHILIDPRTEALLGGTIFAATGVQHQQASLSPI